MLQKLLLFEPSIKSFDVLLLEFNVRTALFPVISPMKLGCLFTFINILCCALYFAKNIAYCNAFMGCIIYSVS